MFAIVATTSVARWTGATVTARILNLVSFRPTTAGLHLMLTSRLMQLYPQHPAFSGQHWPLSVRCKTMCSPRLSLKLTTLPVVASIRRAVTFYEELATKECFLGLRAVAPAVLCPQESVGGAYERKDIDESGGP